MKSNYFQNQFAEYWTEDGVLFFVYKPGTNMDLAAARQVVNDRVEVQKGESYPVFCDMRGVRDSNKAARDYLAKEGSALVRAVAVLIDSPVTKVMLNFYLTISRPLVPTKMFTDKNQALEYLKHLTVQAPSE
jgi:hypothetical protein